MEGETICSAWRLDYNSSRQEFGIARTGCHYVRAVEFDAKSLHAIPPTSFGFLPRTLAYRENDCREAVRCNSDQRSQHQGPGRYPTAGQGSLTPPIYRCHADGGTGAAFA